MWKRIQPYCSITFVVLFSTFILWLPFLLKWDGAGYVYTSEKLSLLDLYKHWDGPLYVIVAKTFYNISSPILRESFLGLNPGYFAAHLPLYPVLIRSTAHLVGYLPSMLAWPVIGAVLYINFFYFFVKKLNVTNNPLRLAFVAAFFTPRFFVIRSVGAPETIFMFLTIKLTMPNYDIYQPSEDSYLFSNVLKEIVPNLVKENSELKFLQT